MTQQQRMEMRLELSRRLGKHIQDLLKDSNDSPEKLYDLMCMKVTERIAELMSDIPLGTNIGERIMNPAMKRRALDRPSFHAFGRPEINWRQFIADCLFDACDGNFRLDTNPTEILATTRSKLRDAFEDREKTASELLKLREISKLAGGGAVSEGDMQETDNALAIQKALGPLVEDLVVMYRNYVTIVPAKDTREAIYPSFFRDIILFERLQFLVSEKIQRLFANRFVGKQKGGNSREQERKFLESIGEFVLASMGILNENSYDLTHKTPLPARDEEARTIRAMSEDRAEHPIVAAWHAKKDRQLFLHRWAEKRPTKKLTPEQIKAFVNDTVQKNALDILSVTKYSGVVDGINEIHASAEDKRTREVMLRRLITDVLTDPQAQEYFREQIRGPWYGALDRFIASDGR